MGGSKAADLRMALGVAVSETPGFEQVDSRGRFLWTNGGIRDVWESCAECVSSRGEVGCKHRSETGGTEKWLDRARLWVKEGRGDGSQL